MREATADEIVELWHWLWKRTTADETTGCWTWTGRTLKGYGRIKWKGREQTVHRLARVTFGESFDLTLVLDHLCRNRACWRPSHLDPCTSGENSLRGETFTAANAAKTHCRHGHELSPDNLVPSAKGKRKCLICSRDTALKYWRKRQAVVRSERDNTWSARDRFPSLARLADAGNTEAVEALALIDVLHKDLDSRAVFRSP